MNALIEAAAEVQQFMRGHSWRFCIIGGLAIVRWGRPRATQDVDFSLLTEFGTEQQYIERLLHAFQSRIPDAHDFALANRVLLLSATNGIPIDVALAGFPFEARVIERATAFEFMAGTPLVTASGEDMVVLKAFAGREQDWSDLDGILIRQGGQLDWEYVVRELTHLAELKDDPALIERLEQRKRRFAPD